MDPDSNLVGIPNSMVDTPNSMVGIPNFNLIGIPNYYSGIMDCLDWEDTLSY